MKLLISRFIMASLVSVQAFAVSSPERDAKIKSLFNDVKKISKGALGLNYYQTATGRAAVMQNGVIVGAPTGTLMTVAFRNDKAQELAALDFFVGNRYASNYWELTNKFLATKEQQDAKAFPMNQVELKKLNAAFPYALSMAKNQMIELYYISKSPTSVLTTSYLQRGVSDADDEAKYYRLYADYLAANLQNESDYLFFIEFQKNSGLLPGKKTISLSGIRQLVATISTNFDAYMTPEMASTFRSLRNSIHNGMNSSVLTALTNFQIANAAIINASDLVLYESLKAQIAAYYKIDKDVLAILLPNLKTDFPEAATLLAGLSQSGNSLKSLLALSELAVSARQKFYVTKNIDLTHLIIRIQQFMDAELGNLNLTTKSDVAMKARALTNMSYATGLMNQERRAAIATQLNQNPDAAIDLIATTMSEIIESYGNAFEPALTDWKLVSTSAAKFVEDGIRASTLIGLDATLSQLKKLAEESPTVAPPTAPVVVTAPPVAPTTPSAPGTGSIVKPPVVAPVVTAPTTPAAPAPTTPIVATPSQPTDAKVTIETQGVAYGYLIFVPKLETEKMVPTLSSNMIPVFETLPLDLGAVAGTITEEPQTPLSHVNMKSKTRKSPNAYIPNASKDSRIAPLLAKKALVRFELKDGVMVLREASLAEAQAFWDASSLKKPIIQLRSDLNERRIRSTKNMGFADVVSVGAKSANYSEGTHILPEAFRPGFAIPFYYYREFIRTNKMEGKTIEQYITDLVNNPRVKTDQAFLVAELAKIQNQMTDMSMVVNKDLVANLKALVTAQYPGQKIRFRSSTNSEDMPQFTGAGLYDSGAYDPRPKLDKTTGLPKKYKDPKKEPSIENALRYVWASVWNLRAFQERELFKINHLDVSMAMLVSPAYPDELANGVGVSRNIIRPELGPGFYLNIQGGSDAVTNPDATITPDQVLVLKKRDPKTGTKYTLLYTKYSRN